MEISDDPVAKEDRDDDRGGAVETVRNYHSQRVVGLGGSAGCIPGLQAFLHGIPQDSGAAFVVVMHLSPEHESRLAQVLQQFTAMPVLQVNGEVELKANTVYVIPPGHDLSIEDSSIRLTMPNRPKGKRVAVDLLFRTLADTHGPNAVAIVFSGSDSDGSIGIKRIKETGGLTVAQDPGEAEHESMPRASIGTGMVDWVLPAGEMADRLLEYWKAGPRVRLPRDEAGEEKSAPEESEPALRGILGHLRARTGRDFSCYKRATILRRIGRRMQVNGLEEASDYLAFLRSHPGEAGALLQDLLISVTNFFRDEEAFHALQAIIPDLFKGKTQQDAVRVWVPACATGEEAYSVAMLLFDYAAGLDNPPALQVFATDIDDEAIQTARAGRYSEVIVADVSEEQLRRHFTRDRGSYVVKRPIREIVLFALHDLLKDPPFSRCDLVTCRNLLIYLNREAQRRVMEIFHFALRPEGKLFLGASELLEDGNGLFAVQDKIHRIYTRRAVSRVSLPVPSGPGLLATALRQSVHALPPPMPRVSAAGPSERPDPVLSRSQLHYKLVEHYAAPSVVVNDEHDIIHLSEHAAQFLEIPGGEPTMNLLRVVHPDLRITLRTALFRAAETSGPAEAISPPITLDGKSRKVSMRVVPVREGGALYMLVLFETCPADNEGPERPAAPAQEPVLRELELELEQVKSNLRETVEQYEATTEELKASNEELQAMNEELRSATEELETSREELQSINEELTAVNQELKDKVDEVGRSNSDLQNLMASTAIATVFLDRELCIARYTPAAVELFNLIPADVGRPLSDLNPRLQYPDLKGDAERVLENLALIEREARHVDGRWFHTRLLPYRTTEDRIGGVVLTLIDISGRKAAEDAVRASDELLQADLESMMLLQKVSDRFVQGEKLPRLLEAIGRAACGLLETTRSSVHLLDPETGELSVVAAEGVEKTLLTQLSSGPNAAEFWAALLQAGRPVLVEDAEKEAPFDGGEDRAALEAAKVGAFVAIPLRTRTGRALGILTCYFYEPHRPSERQLRFLDLAARHAADAIERTQGEEELRRSEAWLRLMIENAREYAIFAMDEEGRVTYWNNGAKRLLGYSDKEIHGKPLDVIFTPEDLAAGKPGLELTIARREGRASDERWHLREDGTRFWASGSLMVMRDERGKIAGFVKILRDETASRDAQIALERSRAEIESASKAKDHFLAVLSHELRTPLTPVLMGVGTLERQADNSELVRNTLEMIRRNIEIEAHFIDDLLDVTRIGQGKLEIVMEEVDVHDALRHAIEISDFDIQQKQHHLAIDLKADECTVQGDRTRLEQVFWNLLKNACKFMTEGGEIAVRSWNEEAKICVSMADRGMGMDPEEIRIIFDAFAQASLEVTRTFGGLGLGLAIAKASVDAHGGELLASSAGRGKGATFTVVLPLCRPETAKKDRGTP